MYLSEELDKEIGQFDAQFLLDFISEEMGPYYIQSIIVRIDIFAFSSLG